MIINSDLGKIDIDRKIFAKCVNKAFSSIDEKGYLVNPRGKALGGVNKNVGINELSQNILLEYKDQEIVVKTFLVINFGQSISLTTNTYFDSLSNEIQKLFPKFKVKLFVKILGVKSIKLKERNIEVSKEYEPRG